MRENEDNKLIASFVEGDEMAFSSLVEKNIDKAYNFIYRFVADKHEADAITQDTFIKIWKNLKRFDLNKNFKTWMFAVAKNTFIDFSRRKKSIAFSEMQNESEEEKTFDLPDDKLPAIDAELDRLALLRKIKEKSENLAVIYKTVLFLRTEEEMSFEEISQILDISVNTAKSRYRRAVEALKKELKDELHPNS